MRTKTVILFAFVFILIGMAYIGVGLAMRDPNWNTPYPNTQHISPTPYPSER